MKIRRKDGTLRSWRLGDPVRVNRINPSILEGLPAIAQFLGKTCPTIKKWILNDGLPCYKNPSGFWTTHKGLIMQWMLAENHAELRGRARVALEEGTLIEWAERMRLPPEDIKEIFGVSSLAEYSTMMDNKAA